VKYKTLRELQQACDQARAEGQEPPVLTLDNDDTHAYQDGECVFRMHPADLIEQALDLLGIPRQEA
jgi:hypothetical protein